MMRADADRLPNEEEALADVRADEYEARLDKLEPEIEVERQLERISYRRSLND